MSERVNRAWIIGVDFRPGGEAALRWALQQEPRRLHLVHVLTQAELDATGRLSAKDKRDAALTTIGRQIMQTVHDVANALLASDGIDVDVSALDLALEPRIAEGHATRAEGLVARALAQVAVDYDAELIVLGRRGRPDSVCDALLAMSEVVGEEPVRLRLRKDAPITKSQAWGG